MPVAVRPTGLGAHHGATSSPQVTRMPVAVRPTGLGATTQREGRKLTRHMDSPAYGDVIITVTMFGEVDFEWRWRTSRSCMIAIDDH